MGNLIFFITLATLFAFVVGVNIRTSNVDGKNVHTDVGDKKLSAFTKIGEKYYMIGTEEELSWYGAAHFCRRIDTQLATIETAEEWQKLSSYLTLKGYTSKRFWFSGNNLDTLKEYYWLSNGQQMHFTKWSIGQPDNARGNEHCAQLWNQKNEFSMNDAPCDMSFHYICEAASPKTVSITIW